MTLQNTNSTYGSVAKLLHWLIAVLIIGMLIFGYFLEDIPKAYASLAFTIHKLTGLTILALVVMRLLWALMNPKPLLPFDVPIWQRAGERLVHYVLYIAMLGMPLAGWIGATAGGRPPRLAEIALSFPVDKNKALSSTSFQIHNTLAIVLIVLISLHVLAALYHHFIKKDIILRRMLPGRS